MKKFILVPVLVVIAAEAALITSHAYQATSRHHQHLAVIAVAAAVFVADVVIAIARRRGHRETEGRNRSSLTSTASRWERVR
jgi:hypothetical protein